MNILKTVESYEYAIFALLDQFWTLDPNKKLKFHFPLIKNDIVSVISESRFSGDVWDYHSHDTPKIFSKVSEFYFSAFPKWLLRNFSIDVL